MHRAKDIGARRARIGRVVRASLLGAAALGASGCVGRGSRAKLTPPPAQAHAATVDEPSEDPVELDEAPRVGLPPVGESAWQEPGMAGRDPGHHAHPFTGEVFSRDAEGLPVPVAPSRPAETRGMPAPSPVPAPRAAAPARARPASPAGGEARYQALPEVTLSPDVERKIARIAEAYHRRTGKELVLTSGTRDVSRQAEAMYELLRLGTDLSKLYRNRAAARELSETFRAGQAARRPAKQIIGDLERVLSAQVARGVYVSAHLRAGAVDVRSRGMTVADKRAFVAGVEEVGGAEVIEEMEPPHFHLELE